MSSPNPVPDPAADPVAVDPLGDPAPRSTRRRFTAEYRDKIIAEYQAAPHGQKSALLRREGLYQSQLREWIVGRDAKRPARSSRRRPAEPVAAAADAVLRRENAQLAKANSRLVTQLAQTEAALEIMGKLHVLLESISQSTDTQGSSPTR